MAVKPRDGTSFYETIDMMDQMPVKPKGTNIPDDPVSNFLMNLGALSLGVSPSEYANIHGQDAGINYSIGQSAYGGLFALAGINAGNVSKNISRDMAQTTDLMGITKGGLSPSKDISTIKQSAQNMPVKYSNKQQYVPSNRITGESQRTIGHSMTKLLEEHSDIHKWRNIDFENAQREILVSSKTSGTFKRNLDKFPEAWKAQKDFYLSGKANVINQSKTIDYRWGSDNIPILNIPDKSLMKRINDLNLTPNTLNTIISKNEQQSVSLNQMLDIKPTTVVDGTATIYRLSNLGALMERGTPRVHGEVDTRGRWSSDDYNIVKRYGQGASSVVSTIKTPADNLLFVRKGDLGRAETGEYIIRDLNKTKFIKHEFFDSKKFPMEEQYDEQPFFEERPDLAPNIQSKLVPLLKSINALDAFSKEYPALGELIKSGKPYIKKQ